MLSLQEGKSGPRVYSHACSRGNLQWPQLCRGLPCYHDQLCSYLDHAPIHPFNLRCGLVICAGWCTQCN
jgi:hypothetical protein